MTVRPSSPSADAIDALLPQTQCRQCGYAGCRPYAEAIATGRAGINQCPPGGEEGIRDLAALLGVPFQPLNPEFGATKPPAVAVIDEPSCIGCTLCIQACPVDAIVGAARVMHTVIAQECTGCELCIPPCPVDCISMVETGRPYTREQKKTAAALARRRFESRNRRRQREKAARAARLAASKETSAAQKKQATIQQAIARARQRLHERGR
ncbi:MAG: RnfABCDGE type electron transport complex subunit B [Burkholderiales bacterium]|nr:RnfABCDGE type electron transport complex subunit B [Burkholderiales bacterium]